MQFLFYSLFVSYLFVHSSHSFDFSNLWQSPGYHRKSCPWREIQTPISLWDEKVPIPFFPAFFRKVSLPDNWNIVRISHDVSLHLRRSVFVAVWVGCTGRDSFLKNEDYCLYQYRISEYSFNKHGVLKTHTVCKWTFPPSNASFSHRNGEPSVFECCGNLRPRFLWNRAKTKEMRPLKKGRKEVVW